MYDGITVSVTGLAINSGSWSVVDLPGNLYERKASEKKGGRGTDEGGLSSAWPYRDWEWGFHCIKTDLCTTRIIPIIMLIIVMIVFNAIQAFTQVYLQKSLSFPPTFLNDGIFILLILQNFDIQPEKRSVS